jgi:hypothetical protein
MCNSNNRTEPLVSVIIPNYNYANYIQDSIASVINQSYRNVEIIVVDDGSTDNSVEVIEKYGNSVTLIQKENSGVSAARNSGMRVAKGDFICFLDSDDSWEPEKITLQISKFASCEIGVVYSSINICDERLNHLKVVKALYKGDIEYLYYKFPTASIVLLGCSSAMIRSELVRSVGEFDTLLHTSADWDYFRRLSKRTKVEFIEEPTVNYRRHNSSMSSGSIENYYRDNELAVIKQLQESIARSGNQLRCYHLPLTWVRFQLGAIKVLLRNKSFRSTIRHLMNLFFRFPG